MTKIRVTIDVDKADDMLSKWSHDNDSYRNGIFGCDEDGIYHMYYQSRNDILEFEDVEIVVDKMYEMCSCGHLGGRIVMEDTPTRFKRVMVSVTNVIVNISIGLNIVTRMVII